MTEPPEPVDAIPSGPAATGSPDPDTGVEWRLSPAAWALIGLVAVALAVAFYGGIAELVNRWSRQEEYSHGFIIPLVAAFFFWQKIPQLRALAFQPSWVGVPVVAIGVAVLLVGELASLFLLVHYAMLIVLVGLTLTVMGSKGLRVIWVALLTLAFAIPLPYFIDSDISGGLQLISSRLGVSVIRLFDIPVYLEGNVIDLGVYKLQVVDACSGLRYLYPLMSFGFICVYIWQAPWWQKIIIFLSTIPITIAMNSFRIGVIGLLVERFGTGAATGFLHFFEGWFIFMACVAILFAEMWLLSRLTGSRVPFLQTLNLAPPAASGAARVSRVRPIARASVLSAALVVSAATAMVFFTERGDETPARQNFLTFPMQLGPWQGRPDPMEVQFIDALGFTDYLMANYREGSEQNVNFYIAYYENQRKGTSPHSPRVCIPGGGWYIAEFDRSTLDGVEAGSAPLPFNRAVIKKGDNQQLVYYWFQQRGRFIANEYLMKWYLFRDAMVMNRTDGALVRLTTPIYPGDAKGAADRRLRTFAAAAIPSLSDYLPP